VRVRRSLLNFATSVLFMAASMAFALKATPWLVFWLGETRYGGSRVLGDGFGYLNLLELGLGGAIAPMLARAVGERDESALRRTVAAGVRAYLKVALATITLGLLLTPFIPRLADTLTTGEAADLQTAWVVGLASFPTLVVLPLRTVVEARQLGYVVNLVLTAQSLAITAGSLLLARAGWGITGVALAQASGVWAFSTLLALGVLHAHPGLLRAVLVTPTSAETRRTLRGLSGPTLLINISGRVSLLADNLIVGKLLGFARVTSLSNSQRLIQMGQSLLQAVGSATWAALAELHAQGARELFNRRVLEITRTVAVLGVVGLAPLVAYNRAFVRIWLGPTFPYAGDAVTILAALNALLLAEQSFWAWCLTATGKVRQLVVPSTAAAALNLAASLALTYKIGLPGPLLGTLIAFAAVGFWALPLLLRSAFGTPVVPLVLAVLKPMVLGALAASALRWLAWRFPPVGWLGLSTSLALSALGTLALSVALLLTRDDRDAWAGRVRAAAGRFRGTKREATPATATPGPRPKP
jgi:O-antigen/teichoic acid export membrane protein